MKIFKLLNEVARENTYILENDSHLLVVDPGSNWDKIRDRLIAAAKPVTAILLTHTHYDHIMSLDLVRDNFGQPPVYVAEEEKDWLFTPEFNLSGLARHSDMDNVIARPAEHVFVNHQSYKLDGFHFKVLPTPGHSAGGVSFFFPDENCVLTGDALFKGSIGRTDLYTGDLEQLKSGIKTQLFTLPDDCTVHPGHGQNTTVSQERHFNPWFH